MMSQFQLVHLGHSHGPAGSITDLHASAPLPFALHWGLVAGESGGTSAGSYLLAASLAPTELASPRTLRGTSGFSL